jgi:MOSC domain-containing protein YiiM
MRGSARIVQISLSAGGVARRAVPPAWVLAPGVRGDVQRDHEHHGGPDRAGDSRVYARVLREGSRTSGDPVQLLTEDEALALIVPR